MVSQRSSRRTRPLPRPYQFVSVKVHQSQRERELTLAQIRQHASRVSRRRPCSNPSESKTRNMQPCNTSCNPSSSKWLDTESDNDHHQLLDQPTYNPWLLSRGFRNDPFDSVPGSNEPFARVGFNFLIDYCFPAGNMINYAFQVASIWSTAILETMAQHAHTFHAIMAMVTAAHEYLAYGKEVCQSKDVMFHKYNAISRLRMRLTEPNAVADDAVVLTMLFLGVTDIGLGHVQDQIIHIRQALSTIRLRGGINGFKNNLGMTSLLIQFEELKKDTLLENWPTHPDLQDQNSRIPALILSQTVSPSVLHDLPTGFYRLARNGCISESTCTIVLRLRHLVATNFSIPCFDSTNLSAQYAGFSQACPPLGTFDCPLIEKLICLAILRHAANAFGRVRSGICPYDGLREALTTKLLTIGIPPRGVERRALIWVWLVAIEAFSSGGYPSVLADRGLDALRLLPVKFTETQKWKVADFQALAEKFLWHDATRLWLQPAWERVTGALHQPPSCDAPAPVGTKHLGVSLWPFHPDFPLPPSFRHDFGEIADCLAAPNHQYVPITQVNRPSLAYLEPPVWSLPGPSSTSPLEHRPSTKMTQPLYQSGQPAVQHIPHSSSTMWTCELPATPLQGFTGVPM